ncbi:2-isopropylmalate synthase [Thermoclostridium caenicola]|uniref:Isopropylmalate/homocitrate/citramalate synthases n=1 Tax=Thermoclostridium caenicola TaxID=659425 RepID=A0A1M6DQQ8_9FIRM|nr:2-isopropylmalate synthase [Thermoclostridium caenicola]SHI75541.1 Isopropylmalate/homocitrate/citramalate synthases [Thermoclostridium caenicola]HOP73058.1 2-isopropylmalate synthase [Thermoclostridium caenicola]
MNVKFNKYSKMMEIEFQFRDVQDPNLFRNIFPYNEVPRLVFNHRVVPMNIPEKLYITDTTFRDGQQSRSPYTVEEISKLFDLLHKLDNGSGIIKQSEFFLYSKVDREAVVKCMEKGYDYPQITSWIRAKKEDFQLVKDMGIKETGILVSCSDYHIFKKLKMTRSQAMEQYLGIVSAALDAGIVPRCHLEDITRADFYGFVLPFVNRLMELSRQAGLPVKIRACDTLGLGVSIPGVALPRSVPQIIYGLVNYGEVPSEWLEWHGHNDFYRAVTNSTTAWLYGAANVNTSLLGIGERTGNTPLEAMVMEYVQLRGDTGGMDLRVITEIAEYFENELNYEIPPRTPFVGRAFNATRAGIHADGLLKDEEIYNIFDTTKILGRPPVVVIDAHSGLAGVAAWINSYFHLKGDMAIDKKDERVARIKAWIDKEYENGRTTVIGDSEMEQLAKEYFPELLSLRQSRVE